MNVYHISCVKEPVRMRNTHEQDFGDISSSIKQQQIRRLRHGHAPRVVVLGSCRVLGGTEGVAKASPEMRPPPWVNKSSYLISLVSFEVKE